MLRSLASATMPSGARNQVERRVTAAESLVRRRPKLPSSVTLTPKRCSPSPMLLFLLLFSSELLLFLCAAENATKPAVVASSAPALLSQAVTSTRASDALAARPRGTSEQNDTSTFHTNSADGPYTLDPLPPHAYPTPPKPTRAAIINSVLETPPNLNSLVTEMQLSPQRRRLAVSRNETPSDSSSAQTVKPYRFSYATPTHSHAENKKSSGAIQGRYVIHAHDGQRRTVDYVADTHGFRAGVATNELGTRTSAVGAEGSKIVSWSTAAAHHRPSGVKRRKTERALADFDFSQHLQSLQRSQLPRLQFRGPQAHQIEAHGGSRAASPSRTQKRKRRKPKPTFYSLAIHQRASNTSAMRSPTGTLPLSLSAFGNAKDDGKLPSPKAASKLTENPYDSGYSTLLSWTTDNSAVPQTAATVPAQDPVIVANGSQTNAAAVSSPRENMTATPVPETAQICLEVPTEKTEWADKNSIHASKHRSKELRQNYSSHLIRKESQHQLPSATDPETSQFWHDQPAESQQQAAMPLKALRVVDIQPFMFPMVGLQRLTRPSPTVRPNQKPLKDSMLLRQHRGLESAAVFSRAQPSGLPQTASTAVSSPSDQVAASPILGSVSRVFTIAPVNEAETSGLQLNVPLAGYPASQLRKQPSDGLSQGQHVKSGSFASIGSHPAASQLDSGHRYGAQLTWSTQPIPSHVYNRYPPAQSVVSSFLNDANTNVARRPAHFANLAAGSGATTASQLPLALNPSALPDGFDRAAAGHRKATIDANKSHSAAVRLEIYHDEPAKGLALVERAAQRQQLASPQMSQGVEVTPNPQVDGARLTTPHQLAHRQPPLDSVLVPTQSAIEAGELQRSLQQVGSSVPWTTASQLSFQQQRYEQQRHREGQFFSVTALTPAGDSERHIHLQTGQSPVPNSQLHQNRAQQYAPSVTRASIAQVQLATLTNTNPVFQPTPVDMVRHQNIEMVPQPPQPPAAFDHKFQNVLHYRNQQPLQHQQHLLGTQSSKPIVQVGLLPSSLPPPRNPSIGVQDSNVILDANTVLDLPGQITNFRPKGSTPGHQQQHQGYLFPHMQLPITVSDTNYQNHNQQQQQHLGQQQLQVFTTQQGPPFPMTLPPLPTAIEVKTLVVPARGSQNTLVADYGQQSAPAAPAQTTGKTAAKPVITFPATGSQNNAQLVPVSVIRPSPVFDENSLRLRPQRPVSATTSTSVGGSGAGHSSDHREPSAAITKHGVGSPVSAPSAEDESEYALLLRALEQHELWLAATNRRIPEALYQQSAAKAVSRPDGSTNLIASENGAGRPLNHLSSGGGSSSSEWPRRRPYLASVFGRLPPPLNRATAARQTPPLPTPLPMPTASSGSDLESLLFRISELEDEPDSSTAGSNAVSAYTTFNSAGDDADVKTTAVFDGIPPHASDELFPKFYRQMASSSPALVYDAKARLFNAVDQSNKNQTRGSKKRDDHLLSFASRIRPMFRMRGRATPSRQHVISKTIATPGPKFSGFEVFI